MCLFGLARDRNAMQCVHLFVQTFTVLRKKARQSDNVNSNVLIPVHTDIINCVLKKV